MFQDSLFVSPFHGVGTVTRRWLVAVSFVVFLPPAFGQEHSAPAPLPRNLTPNQAPHETIESPTYALHSSAADATCEPSFQPGVADDCNYCLELWQGYCHERRGGCESISPRRLLSCWRSCCSLLTRWRGCGIPIAFGHRVSASDECSTCPSGLCCAADQAVPIADPATGGSCSSHSREMDGVPRMAPEPVQPVAPPDPEPAPVVPQNDLPDDDSNADSLAPSRATVVAGQLAPEPPRLRVKRASGKKESGTVRLIRALECSTD